MVLTDVNTIRDCYPLIGNDALEVVELPDGEGCKSLEVANFLWETLSESGYGRQDYLVTLGGGSVSDVGAFVASTYMRGMRLVHVPTTLLGMIDAGIGGKTAINFGGIKNLVGTFYHPDAIWISIDFLPTLSDGQLMSGMGEMVKYGLLTDQKLLDEVLDMRELSTELIGKVVQYKLDVVAEDFTDKGVRAFLNLGHTSAHAFEALYMERGEELLHGVAVAAGLVVALYLSFRYHSMDESLLRQVAYHVRDRFPNVALTCDDYHKLWAFAQKDKKRVEHNVLAMVLLSDIGDPFMAPVDREHWEEALDFYRDLVG